MAQRSYQEQPIDMENCQFPSSDMVSKTQKRQQKAGKLYGENHPKEVSQIVDQPLGGKSTEHAARDYKTNRQYVSEKEEELL